MNWKRIAKSGFVSHTLLFRHESLADVGLGGFAYIGTLAAPPAPAAHEEEAPNRDDRTGGRGHQTMGARSDRANLHRKHRFGLAPLLQQRCGVRNPWNRNWKSSASNEQVFEVVYDFAITPAIRLIPGYQRIWKPLAAQVTKGTNQADVFLTRLTGAW
jgi:hypothetical protein